MGQNQFLVTNVKCHVHCSKEEYQKLKNYFIPCKKCKSSCYCSCRKISLQNVSELDHLSCFVYVTSRLLNVTGIRGFDNVNDNLEKLSNYLDIKYKKSQIVIDNSTVKLNLADQFPSTINLIKIKNKILATTKNDFSTQSSEINEKKFFNHIDRVVLNSQRFPALRIKIRHLGLINIFGSGCVIILGCKSYKKVKTLILILQSILQCQC